MFKGILPFASVESVTEVIQGRQTHKLALITHGIPVVAATYSARGSRLCHENIANLSESGLKKCLTELDHRAANKVGQS